MKLFYTQPTMDNKKYYFKAHSLSEACTIVFPKTVRMCNKEEIKEYRSDLKTKG